ncbi:MULTISPECIES: hypothetical protein [Streptomyces]|uniref:Antitoxin n=1 Tax=Streptomyces milbemycinicus TaxID=476552 RepID=A0ABW8M699_9ACTN|nr:hypothetical protein [Streptomyces hygroscopicus]GLV79392.1 hypothetical protein Shyhy02_73920 [Streptomyces hygroscopicus subsp. hygroscopicus]
MTFTSAERAAITAHAAVLGLSADEYIRQTAVDRALSWQRERDAFQAMAQRRGCTVEELVQRGCLKDDVG